MTDMAPDKLSTRQRRIWNAAIEAAAKICDEYADVNIEAAGDSVLHDPCLSGKGFSPENVAISEKLMIEGCIHSSMFHAAQNIAETIRKLKEHLNGRCLPKGSKAICRRKVMGMARAEPKPRHG